MRNEKGMPMTRMHRPAPRPASARHPAAGRRSRMVSAALALVLAASLGASTPVAFADDLEDQQAALREEAARVQHSLEFVDSRIAQAAADLVLYQGQLPGAQQALLEAQGRVASAVKEAEALAARVDLAQQNKAKITQQLETDKQKIADTKKLIGQIATQAYKSGGVPSNLSLFFGSNNGGSLTDTIDLADQAMRSQNSAMDKLTQQNATNVNSQARLEAVEAEIKDLKAKADAALAREQAARDEAEAKKAQVDQLIADTTRLDAELQAAKPGIQSQLAQVKAQQDAVAAEIVERDRKLREAWEAEQRRIAEAAGSAAAAAAAACPGQIRPPPAAVCPGPAGTPVGIRAAAPLQRRADQLRLRLARHPAGHHRLLRPGRLHAHRHRLRRGLRHAGLRRRGRQGVLRRLGQRRRRQQREDLPRRCPGQLADHHLLPQRQRGGFARASRSARAS